MSSSPVSSLPTPTPVSDTTDLRAFFDRLAANNTERHGPAEKLLARRLRVLNQHAQFSPSDVVLDIGCGDGAHLRALADRIDTGIGIDLSPEMIASARQKTPESSPLQFRVGDAEQLDSVPEASVDKVICVGVLEHVLRPHRVLRQAARVLRPSGRFVALTLNGAYWWYRVADRFGLPTRHLTTDQRLAPDQARRMIRRAGLRPKIGFWRFIPRGDVPRPIPTLCRVLDALGGQVNISSLRGGLWLGGRLQ